jgi:hypothetical protein
MIKAQEEGRQSTTRPGATPESLQKTSAQPQRSLFPETEAVTQRATPENFQKMLDSKNVQGMREAIAQQKTDNQAALQSVLSNIQPAKTAAQKAEEALNKAKQKATPLLEGAAKERGEPTWYAPAVRKVVELETALQSIPPRLKLLKDIREKITGLNESQKETLVQQVDRLLTLINKNPKERTTFLKRLKEQYKEAKYFATKPDADLVKSISDHMGLVEENLNATFSANKIKELFELKQALASEAPLSKEINRLTAAVRLAKRTIDKARTDLNSLVEQHVGDKTIRESLLAQADKATENIDKLTKAFEETKTQEARAQAKPAEEKPATEATPMKVWREALQRGREGLDLPGVRNLRDTTDLKAQVLAIRKALGSFDAQLSEIQDPKRKPKEGDKAKIVELEKKRADASTALDTVYKNAPRITSDIYYGNQSQLDLEKEFDKAQAAAYDRIARKKRVKTGELSPTLRAAKKGPVVTDVRTNQKSESGTRQTATPREELAATALEKVAKGRAELKELQDRMQYLRDNNKDKKSGRYTDTFKQLQAKEELLRSTIKQAENASAVFAREAAETKAALASSRKSVEGAQSGKEAIALREAEEQRQAEASGPILENKNAPSKFYVDRTTTPLSEQAIEMAQEGRILDLAAELAKNGSTPEIRAAAAKLQPLLLRTKFIVDEGVTYRGESVAGLYNPQNNSITMHPKGLTEEDVLHEMGHAATDYVLLADPATLKADQRAARKELEALHTRITKSDSFKGEQGIDSVREFAAEVISNKEFRNKLDVVGKPTTLLQRVLSFIKRMLGMQTTVSGKETQALVDRILAPSRKLAAKATPSRATSPDSFAKWFGNSKVVDDDGKPLVVYHGTKTRFSTFSAKQNLDAIGFWFSSKDGTAESSIFSGDSGVVIPAYLSIQNPFVLYQTKELGARMNPERALFKALGLLATEMPTRYAVKQELIRRGYDGVKITFEGYDDVHYVALKSTQIRSAVNEQNATPSMFRKGADYKSDDALTQLAKKAVAQDKTFRERAGSHIGLQFEMAAADMRAAFTKAMNNAVEDPKTMGSTKLFRQAIFSITAADQHMATTQMSLSNGPPEMRKDAKGYYTVASSMKNDAGQVFDAVQDIPDSYGDTQAKMGLASVYMIAQRALNKGLKKLDLGALGVTEQELQAAMAAANADPKLGAALESVRKKYNAYNRGMIEWLSSPQVAAISQADAKAYLKDEDYVPYYRVRADGTAELVFGGEKTLTIGDIRHQPYLAELKGGEAKIMPLDKSIMRNTMLLVTKGMNNMAMKNVGYAMQAAGDGLGPIGKNGKPTNLMPINIGKGPDQANVIRWTQEPDPNRENDKGDRYLRVETNDTLFGGIPAELIIKSLDGAHLTLPAFLKWGGIAGDVLRSGITRTPIYLARQLFRDPFAATATSGLDYGPITAIFKANKEFLKIAAGKSETGAKMIEKGLLQSGLFEGDVANMSKIALQLASGKSQSTIDRLLAGADRLALQADAATRTLIYDNAIKNGLSEAEADHAVRESMNFSKRGLSPTVQYASRMIPFFNAQIQGLSVLVKAATGNMPAEDVLKIKRKFANNAMMLTGFGLAYAMAMDDDEYYKNAKPRDRYSNFFIPLPGVDEPLKLPIPYEFGFFFSAGVALADAIKGEVDTPQQLRAIKDMFVGAIPGASGNFVPQIVKPLAEVYANKNFFSGTPLESARLEKLKPEARYNAHTTEVAKWMATVVPGLSPIQIEHIVSGYLGQIPLMVLASTNEMFRDGKEEPTRKLSEMPLIGSSFQRKYGGEEADVVYKLANDAMEAKRTFDNYRKTGKLEDAKEFLADNRAEIMVAPLAAQYQKIMGALRKQEEVIRNSNASSDAKEKRIDALNAQRQLQSERYLKAIRRAEAAGGRTTPQ